MDVQKAILISLEDERSARRYFDGFTRELQSQRIVVIAKYRGSDPKSVVDAAKEERDERIKIAKRDLVDPFDEVWVVFDTEGPQNVARQTAARHAIQQAKDLGFSTAVSNPCFEYWYLLHFEYCVSQVNDVAVVIRRLRQHVKDYDKGKDYFGIMRPNTELAIEKAKKAFAERHKHTSQHPCDCHPCTEVYRLVESLLGR